MIRYPRTFERARSERDVHKRWHFDRYKASTIITGFVVDVEIYRNGNRALIGKFAFDTFEPFASRTVKPKDGGIEVC